MSASVGASALRRKTPSIPVERAVTSLARNGVRGTARRVRERVLTPLWRRLYLREEHTWLTVPVRPEGAQLPDGYTLRLGGEEDLADLAAGGGIGPATARRYLARGARLYVARDQSGELAFSTWIHVTGVPMLAARGGELALPEGIVSFEDSLATPAHRRSGVASRVVDEVTAREQRAGARLLITRIEAGNEAVLRWSQKMGATPVAIVRLRRIAGRQRVDVETIEGGEAVAALLSAAR